MPFGNVPKKNPGRYFEQFVKVQLLSLLLIIIIGYCVYFNCFPGSRAKAEPKQQQHLLWVPRCWLLQLKLWSGDGGTQWVI